MKAKRLPTSVLLDNLLNEASILSELEHPNIIKILKVSINGDLKKADGRRQQVI